MTIFGMRITNFLLREKAGLFLFRLIRMKVW